MKQHILIIDDNPTNLKLACSVLEMEGYEITKAESAEEGLRLVGETTFDMILTDIGLPGMDGLALTRVLRENSSTRNIPIVAISAFAMKGDEERALEAGCDGYITKPIDTRKLPEQIVWMLGIRGAKPGGGV